MHAQQVQAGTRVERETSRGLAVGQAGHQTTTTTIPNRGFDPVLAHWCPVHPSIQSQPPSNSWSFSCCTVVHRDPRQVRPSLEKPKKTTERVPAPSEYSPNRRCVVSAWRRSARRSSAKREENAFAGAQGRLESAKGNVQVRKRRDMWTLLAAEGRRKDASAGRSNQPRVPNGCLLLPSSGSFLAPSRSKWTT